MLGDAADLSLFAVPEAAQLLEEICAEKGVDPALIRGLIRLEQDFSGMLRRRGLFEHFDTVIGAAAGEAAP
jgi:hypothetical protein